MTQWKDGAEQRYDRKGHHWLLDASGCPTTDNGNIIGASPCDRSGRALTSIRVAGDQMMRYRHHRRRGDGQLAIRAT